MRDLPITSTESSLMIERMFLAVTPPAEVIEAVADLPTRALRGVRYTKQSQWHITVRFLGETDRNTALAALETLTAPSTHVTLGPEVTLLGERVVMIPAQGLDEVARIVAQDFADVGEPSDRAFAGHLTLARLKGRPLRDPSLVSVLGESISATFPVDTIELWKTELSPGGAEYTLVATQDLT